MSKQVVDIRKSDKFEVWGSRVYQHRDGKARGISIDVVEWWASIRVNGRIIDHPTALRYIQGCGLEFRIEDEQPKPEPYRLVPVPTHGAFNVHTQTTVAFGTLGELKRWIGESKSMEIVVIDWDGFLAERKEQA